MAKLDEEYPALWWEPSGGGRIQCLLCPHQCIIQEGERGFCRGRMNSGGRMRLDRWQYISGLCMDPIEKKPLYHFHPGSRALSFGTAGCNLDCAFCQNHGLSRSLTTDRLTDTATPQEIAETALSYEVGSVAFTYNEPAIFAEYAIAVANACRMAGIRSVAVTAGYVNPQPARTFFSVMDAANVDLKGFSDSFYRDNCGGRLMPVLDTLSIIRRETTCHLEITNLIIPGLNDSEAIIKAMCDWIARELGQDVPLHFSAFHPAWRLDKLPQTPPSTLAKARRVAIDSGLRYVYTGNIKDREGSTTWCPGCGRNLVERDWFTIRHNELEATGGRCPRCGTTIPGHFA